MLGWFCNNASGNKFKTVEKPVYLPLKIGFKLKDRRPNLTLINNLTNHKSKYFNREIVLSFLFL